MGCTTISSLKGSVEAAARRFESGRLHHGLGSPIRRLPSRGGDLLRGKCAPVGGESCGFWNGSHETTMALLYTMRSAKPTSVEDTTVPQTRSLRQHLLLTWADVSKERPPTFYGISSIGRAAVSKSAGCRFEACVPSQYNGVSRVVVTPP